jgi:hypothetical protein
MHTIKIEVSDTIYDNVMFFLKNLPKSDIKLHHKETPDNNTLVSFFANTPIKDIDLERSSDIYQSKVDF